MVRIRKIQTGLASAIFAIGVLLCSTPMANTDQTGGLASRINPLVGLQVEGAQIKPMATALSTLDSMAMGSSEIPLSPEINSKRYKQVDVGEGAVCAIRGKDAGIECFGFNSFGQASPPTGKFKSISMGAFHGCAITQKNKLVCWGQQSSYPTEEVTKAHKYLQVSSGTDHTCAIDTRGKVTCWGDNSLGETDVPTGRFIDISAYGDHTCALNKAKNIQCWGDKAFLSEGPFNGSFSQISTGALHICALRTSDQQAVCWGNNAYGQSIPGMGPFKNLVSGIAHTCGHRDDGTVTCWGRNQYGQTNADTRTYRLVAAGGNQTCLLNFPENHLICSGSFEFNDELFGIPNQTSFTGGGGSQGSFVTARNSMGDFIGGGVNWFGSSVADGLEVFYNKDLSNVVKFAKYGNIVFSLASLLVSNLLEEPDPNAERYRQIQADLASIKLELTQIKGSIDILIAESRSTAYIVSAQWCNDARKPLDDLAGAMQDSGVSYKGPVEQWKIIIDAYQAYLTKAEKNKTALVDNDIDQIYSDIEKYRARWFNKDVPKDNLERLSNTLHQSLINENIGDSPLDVCKAPAWERWRTQRNLYPFDDRHIWSESYKVLIRSMALQDQIADIQTQMAVLDVMRALQGPLTVKGKAIAKYNREAKRDQWNGMGICALAENVTEKGGSEPNPDNVLRLKNAWNPDDKLEADGPCVKHRDLVKQIYTQQVKQIEYMGGSYSNKDVMLSLTSEQLGIKTPQDSAQQSNWLWFRPFNYTELKRERYSSMPVVGPRISAEYQPVESKWSAKRDASPYLGERFPISVSNFPLYMTRQNDQGQSVFGEYVWHSNGSAWRDAHRARLDQKLSNPDEKDVLEDFMENLSSYPSYDSGNDTKTQKPTKKPLFREIKGLAFWMPFPKSVFVDQTVRYVTQPVVTYQGYDPAYKQPPVERRPETDSIYDYFAPPCFMAEKANSGVGADGSGAWFLDDQKKEQFLKLSGKVCTNEEFAALLRPNDQLVWKNGVDCRTDGRCAGIGVGFPSNKYFDKFNGAFGGNFSLTYELWGKYGSGIYWTQVYGLNALVNNMDLYHLPVVKITDIPCGKSLLPDKNGVYPTRQGTRQIPAKKVVIPSVCGEDLDRIINSMVPRSPYIDLTAKK